MALSGLSARGRCTCTALVLAILLFGLNACEKPSEIVFDAPVTVGDMEFQLMEASVRHVELDSVFDVYEYPRPVLALTVQITNQGDNDFVYLPTNQAEHMVESTTPLLYRPLDSSETGVEGRAVIRGVLFDKGQYPDQMTSSITLKPGEKIRDVFLFEVPEKSPAALILSLPPTMHRGDLPVQLGFHYEAQNPVSPKHYKAGEVMKWGDAEVKVTQSEIAYIPLKKGDDDGYSASPLFKITYEITNRGSSPIEYRGQWIGTDAAEHYRLATLSSGTKRFSQAKLGQSMIAKEQHTAPVVIEPGKSLNDYLLFEVPGEEVDELLLELPAHLVGQRGLGRITMEYKHHVPELPEELRQ